MIYGSVTDLKKWTVFMDRYKFSIGHNGKLHKFSHNSKDVLLSEVMRFHNENNINFNFIELSKSIDRQSKLVVAPKKITLQDAIKGAQAVIKYGTGSSVGNEELFRRSMICKACPLMKEIGGCRSCGAAGAIARFVNKIKSTYGLQMQIPPEVRENYCGFCGCSLALMVVTKLQDFKPEPDQINQTRPDSCWLKRTSTNFNNEQ